MDKLSIENVLGPRLEELGLFLVELSISEGNSITVYADGMENITVDQCSAITRHLREKLGEAADSYEITVSSPGLDRPFKHTNQYLKNVGKSVEVLMTDGEKLEGKIDSVTEGGVVINPYKKRNPKNKSLKPELSGVLVTVQMDKIKQTKKLIII